MNKYNTQCGIILEKDAIIGQQNKDYNMAMSNKQAMIVFDPNHINGWGGFNIESAKSFALNFLFSS